MKKVYNVCDVDEVFIDVDLIGEAMTKQQEWDSIVCKLLSAGYTQVWTSDAGNVRLMGWVNNRGVAHMLITQTASIKGDVVAIDIYRPIAETMQYSDLMDALTPLIKARKLVR